MTNDGKVKDVDGMLAHVGDFSRYQAILIGLFASINILSAFHYFGQTFTSLVPAHICDSSIYNQSGISARECSILFFNQSDFVEESCQTGWLYNNSNLNGYVSLAEELNWVCSNTWKSVLGQSVFFLGSILGGIVFGVLADTIGRLHVLVLANTCALVGNLLTTLSSNSVVFAISRFIAGCATDTNFAMMYIIVMEYLRPNKRTLGLNITIGIFYTLSSMAIPWVAVWIGHWKWFLALIGLLHVQVFLFYLILPESAQWLISKGRTMKAVECFKKIAKINKRVVEDQAIESLQLYCQKHIKDTKQENFFGLLKTRNLRRKTLILIYKSMVLTLCYDAISKNITQTMLSPFMVFTVSSSTILPACLLLLLLQDRIGRKALASGSLTISGTFSTFAGIYLSCQKNPSPMVVLILAVVARFGINVAYNSGHQYAVELIPTVVRGQGVAVVHVAGYAAAFFSTQILYLAEYWKPSPEIILGVLMITGAIACVFLPETLNKTLPVTLADGESFGEDENVWECWSKLRKYLFMSVNKVQ